MTDHIGRRIKRELGSAELTELLADNLSGSDLHSLLLAVLKRRIERLEATSLLQPSSVTKACDLDARLLNKIEGVAYETAARFESIALSPVSPLGSVSVLTGLDQANVLSTVRAFECASDPTVGMALECARRRKQASARKSIAKLCASQRVVRFPLPANPAYTAHFNLFSLVTAGRDTGSFSFEIAALREHVGVYLSLMSRLADEDISFEEVDVEISDTRVVSHLCSLFDVDRNEIRAVVRARNSGSASELLDRYSISWPKLVTNPEEELAQYELPKHLVVQMNLLAEHVCAALMSEHNKARIHFNLHRLTGLGYYDGPCFHIKAKNAGGQLYMIADGGFVNWTKKMLCDKKERLMTSAIGVELICRMFRDSGASV